MTKKQQQHIFLVSTQIIILICSIWFYHLMDMDGLQPQFGFRNKWYGVNLIPFKDFFAYLTGTSSWLGRTVAYVIFGFLIYGICINTIYKNSKKIERGAINLIFLIFIFFMLMLSVYTANMNVIIDINNFIFYFIGFYLGVYIYKGLSSLIKNKKFIFKFK